MGHFDHETLDVYQAGIEFVAKADEIVEQLPRGRAYLADQLERAATSVPLNVAEGAGEFSKKDKARPVTFRLPTSMGEALALARKLRHHSPKNRARVRERERERERERSETHRAGGRSTAAARP